MTKEQLKRSIDQAQNSGEIWTAIWSVFDYLQETEVGEKKPTEIEIEKSAMCGLLSYTHCPGCGGSTSNG